MQITNISDAKTHLSRLIEKTQAGETIIIGKAGKPVAVLSAYSENTMPRILGGSWQGKVVMSGDFDTLPEEALALFYKSVMFPENE